MKVEPKFKLEHWSHRWLTRKQFNIRHPDLISFPTGNSTQLNIRDKVTEEDNDDDRNITDQFTQNSSSTTKARDNTHGQTYISDYVTNNIGDTLIEDEKSNISYKDLVDCCAELCRS